MRAWASFGVLSLLFVAPSCGTVSRRGVSQSPAPQAGEGSSTDSGDRWLGAEPVGGLVVETTPRVQPARSQPSPSRSQPSPPALPAARAMPRVPTPVPVTRLMR